jgi:hypothetical protein
MTTLVSSCNGFQSSLFHVGLCLCLGGTPVLALGMGGGASPCFLLPSLLQVSAMPRSKGQESNTPSFFASSFLGTNFTLLVFLCLPKTGAASSSSFSPSLYYNVVSSARMLPKNHFSIDKIYRKKAVREGSLSTLSVVIRYRATRQDSGLNSEQGQLESTYVCLYTLLCYRTLSQRQCRWINLGSTRCALRTEAVGTSPHTRRLLLTSMKSGDRVN